MAKARTRVTTKDLACRQLLRVAVDGFETKMSILLVKVQSMQR
jgi:hypothetical protein